MRQHILVVDDDDDIRELLGLFLVDKDYVVSTAADTKACEALLQDFIFDLLIIDVMMPHESGIEFLKRRRDSLAMPIIILTALGDVDDRVNGLAFGANDYLAKPFEPQELLLRIQNLLRYSRIPVKTVLQFGQFKYDIQNHLLFNAQDVPINLTTNEQILLYYMLQKPGRIISREEITALFPGSSFRAVDTMVARLRNKIEVDSKNPVFLQTMRSQGYVFRY